MKVIALGLRSRGREGRGGAGGPVAGAEAGEEVYAASLCGAAFCCCFSLKTFHSFHRVLWLQCPQRRGPAPGGSGAAGPRGPACLPVARHWLGTRRLPQAVLRYLLQVPPFAPGFLRDPYLETLHPASFATSVSPVISLIGSVVNPVRSRKASGQLSPAGIPCFRRGGLHGSSCDDAASLVG